MSFMGLFLVFISKFYFKILFLIFLVLEQSWFHIDHFFILPFIGRSSVLFILCSTSYSSHRPSAHCSFFSHSPHPLCFTHFHQHPYPLYPPNPLVYPPADVARDVSIACFCGADVDDTLFPNRNSGSDAVCGGGGGSSGGSGGGSDRGGSGGSGSGSGSGGGGSGGSSSGSSSSGGGGSGSGGSGSSSGGSGGSDSGSGGIDSGSGGSGSSSGGSGSGSGSSGSDGMINLSCVKHQLYTIIQ